MRAGCDKEFLKGFPYFCLWSFCDTANKATVSIMYFGRYWSWKPTLFQCCLLKHLNPLLELCFPCRKRMSLTGKGMGLLSMREGAVWAPLGLAMAWSSGRTKTWSEEWPRIKGINNPTKMGSVVFFESPWYILSFRFWEEHLKVIPFALENLCFPNQTNTTFRSVCLVFESGHLNHKLVNGSTKK